jgi:hypothetical protein
MLKIQHASRLALVIAVGTVLFHAPSARCCSHLDSHQASVSDVCCAATPCCVISDGTAEKPLTPASVANELSAVSAPVCLVSLIDFPAGPQVARFAKAQPVAHAPPPLALSCIFLI